MKNLMAVVFNLIGRFVLQIYSFIKGNEVIIDRISKFLFTVAYRPAPKLPDYRWIILTQKVHFSYKNVNHER
jgi:hypothetical protein